MPLFKSILPLLGVLLVWFSACSEQKPNPQNAPFTAASTPTETTLPQHQAGDVWLPAGWDDVNRLNNEVLELIENSFVTVDKEPDALIINGKHRFHVTSHQMPTNEFFAGDSSLAVATIKLFERHNVDISHATPYLYIDNPHAKGFEMDTLTLNNRVIATNNFICFFFQSFYPVLYKRVHVKDKQLVRVAPRNKIKVQEQRFPTDKEKNVSIILQGMYRGEPVSNYAHMMHETWYDFYQNHQKQFFLSKARIKIGSTYDDCVGENATTVGSSRESIMLIHGIMPKQKRVVTLRNFPPMVTPGDVQRFQFGGANYELSAAADLSGTFSDSWDNIFNYQLYLTKAGSTHKQLLVTVPYFADTAATIDWMGDMDNDQKPDFVIDVSENYEEKYKILLLSGKAKAPDFVECAGRSGYSFDC